MRILIDFLPILLFFGAYKFYGIYVGTAVLMAATVAQMGLIYAIDRRLQTMHKATLVLILLFGTLTLVLQDDRFIKWKPTVLYGAMALALAVALWALKKNFLKMLLGGQLALPDTVWTRLTVAWIAYCAFMSAINAYVVLNYSTEAWVDFKLWGYVFPLVFLIGQGIYIAPHLKDDDEPAA
ncbi:MAG: septation protein A [Acidovorax sp.]|uniref:septation protein A n=1 Tax=Acidovorax sp. TaxID=1872122 RepID=UPI0039E3F9B5